MIYITKACTGVVPTQSVSIQYTDKLPAQLLLLNNVRSQLPFLPKPTSNTEANERFGRIIFIPWPQHWSLVAYSMIMSTRTYKSRVHLQHHLHCLSHQHSTMLLQKREVHSDHNFSIIIFITACCTKSWASFPLSLQFYIFYISKGQLFGWRKDHNAPSRHS